MLPNKNVFRRRRRHDDNNYNKKCCLIYCHKTNMTGYLNFSHGGDNLTVFCVTKNCKEAFSVMIDYRQSDTLLGSSGYFIYL